MKINIVSIGITLFVVLNVYKSFSQVNQAPASIVVPVPLTVGIDDLGWKQGWSTDVEEDRNKPHHIDCPEGRWMNIQDYESVVSIAKAVKTRLLCLFVMSEFDRSDICAEYPSTTEQGINWDNSALVSDDDFEIMDYVKKNAGYMEFGLHGVRHEYWEKGQIQLGEFANFGYNKHPYPIENMQNHLNCFKRLLDQYDITFPKTFVPPKHCYYHNPDDTMDTGGLMASWGVKYVSWGHKYWEDYNKTAIHPLANCVYNHGVLVLERDQNIPWSGSLGVALDSISTKFYYETTHWHNYVAASSEDNPSVAEKWIQWFNRIKESEDRYLPKNTAQLYAQALYLKYSKIEIQGNKLSIDNTLMPEWAYKNGFAGTLVLKVPLEEGKHVSAISFEDNRSIMSYYEERGYGYVFLPTLEKKKYDVEIWCGEQKLTNSIVNEGTYNINQGQITDREISFDIEMYGTQEIHIRLGDYIPHDIISNTEGLIVNSWEWIDNKKICVLNLTAPDIQGARGEIILKLQN